MFKRLINELRSERSLWGNVGQWGGLLFINVGLILECWFKADMVFILITGGSLIYAVGTKLKHERSS